MNSYKRLVPGHEAPVHVSWARNNRSALVRVPTVKASKADSTRIEYRAPDAAANPYLCFAVILAAGMAGIRGGYELPEEATGNLFDRAAGRDLELLPDEPQGGDRPDGGLDAAPRRRSASTSSSGSCATSARSGRPTPRR